MSERIKAIYQNGVLYPLTPLALADNTQVEVIVQMMSVPDDPQQHRLAVHEALVIAGLSLPQQGKKLVVREGLPASYRQEELSRMFSTGKPLSEIILEEREER